MTKDILSEMITSIRNAVRVKRPGVKIPNTRLTQSLAKILVQEGLVEEVLESFFYNKKQKKKKFLFLRLKYFGLEQRSVITNLQRVSRPGLRIYTNHKEIPEIFGGLGLIILSTPKGLITDRYASSQKLGGEICCSIW